MRFTVSTNKHNIDAPDLGPSGPGAGPHLSNRLHADADTTDRAALGREAHRADRAQADAREELAGDAPHGPMSADQAERLRILSAEAGVAFEADLDAAAADRRLRELQREAGRRP